ncbi:polyprenyl synthetase family protein [Parapedobacter sp.]
MDTSIPILAANYTSMYHTHALQDRIADGLADLGIPEHPANLYDPVRYMLQIGGKRIRPLLTLMAADLFSITDMWRAVPAALAVELFHNFSLVHDDIMDHAPLRRGHRTVHEKWDSNVGILSGDNLLIMAYAQLAKCPTDCLPAILDTFNTMAAQVCEGQQLDMDFERATAVSIDEYLRMIRLKTSVLLGAALKMGALLAGATDTGAQLIYDFGVDVGIAFQLQDDILDVYADPKQFGKQRGGDILANKKTYLLLKALEMADTATRSKLDGWLADHSEPSEKINRVTAIYDALGIRAEVETAKQRYVERAYTALDAIPVDISRKAPLRELAHALLSRGQ